LYCATSFSSARFWFTDLDGWHRHTEAITRFAPAMALIKIAATKVSLKFSAIGSINFQIVLSSIGTDTKTDTKRVKKDIFG